MARTKPVNIVYTRRGTIGIENQTRYSTEAILALANALEAHMQEGAVRNPYRPRGAVFSLVDWRHKRGMHRVRRPDSRGVYDYVTIPYYVEDRNSASWDTIKVVPPDRLFSDPLEALSWDQKSAPVELTHQLALRLIRELGFAVWDMQEKLRNMPEATAPLPVTGSRGSRCRGANRNVTLASLAERDLRAGSRRAYSARWSACAAQRRTVNAASRIQTLRPDLSERLRLRSQELEYLTGRLIEINQDINDIANTINAIDFTRKE